MELQWQKYCVCLQSKHHTWLNSGSHLEELIGTKNDKRYVTILHLNSMDRGVPGPLHWLLSYLQKSFSAHKILIASFSIAWYIKNVFHQKHWDKRWYLADLNACLSVLRPVWFDGWHYTQELTDQNLVYNFLRISLL